MIDDVALVERLVAEIELLRADTSPDSPLLTFGAGPVTAYAVVASLQFALRNPELTCGLPREVVESFAHQIADALIERARARIGPDSALETTLTMGFDPGLDRGPDGEGHDA